MTLPRRFRDVAVSLAALALLLGAWTLAASAQTPFAPTRFTVVTEGAAGAPEILLLPGLTSSREVFASEAKLLAPSHRLLRVQINGFAGQPAGVNATGPLLKPAVEELHQYLAANHLHPAVIGHSLGGLLGLMLADAHPDDVTRLLVVDALPFYALVFSPQATVEVVRPQAQAMRDIMLKQTAEAYAAGAQQTAAILCNDPDGRKMVAANSVASDRTVFTTAMYEDLTTDLRPELAAIKTATTVLYPYDPAFQGPDPASVINLYTTAYSSLPNVKLQRIDGSRHFIMYDQPAAFDKAVQAFLK